MQETFFKLIKKLSFLYIQKLIIFIRKSSLPINAAAKSLKKFETINIFSKTEKQ